MGERFKTNSAVQLFLIREKNGKTEILLQKRKNCWAEGMWDSSASGHVEQGEPMTASLHREALEEIGIEINRDNIAFINMQHSNLEGLSYYNGYFFVKDFSGVPTIHEHDKCC